MDVAESDAASDVASDAGRRRVVAVLRRLLRGAGVVAAALLMVTVPVSTAVVAVAYAPATTIQVAGEDVAVKPVLGQANSQLFGGALIVPRYARLPVLDKVVGLRVDANFNRLVPSDKETRAYLGALWSDPAPAINAIERAARRHLLLWAAAGFTAGVVTDVAVVLLALRRRRLFASYTPEQAEAVASYTRPGRRVLTCVGVVAALILGVAGWSAYAHDDRRTLTPAPALDGTALEGTEVTGLLANALPFLSVIQPRTEFYEKVGANLEDAVAADGALAKGDDEVAFVLAEDFEDVNGMAQQVGLAADLIDANFVALSGDLTFAGKAVETYVLDTIDYYSDKRPVWLAPGLHDTDTVIRAAQARDWHVADGTTHDVDGLRLLAAPDPRVSTVGDFGTVDKLRDPDVGTSDFVVETAKASCAQDTDFVLLHDHRLGEQIAKRGCARVAVLDGRSFEHLGPREVITEDGRSVVQFTSGSAGGHVSTDADPGVIKHPATFTLFYFDKTSGETSYALVTVEPDTSVDIAPREVMVAGETADTAGRVAR